VSLDYEIVTLTMPMLYLGTLFGVQVGTYLSELQLAVSLSCVMFFVTYKTTQKALKMYRDEKAKEEAEKSKQVEMASLEQRLITNI
jgi:uncharacterized membrane protein YfcA